MAISMTNSTAFPTLSKLLPERKSASAPRSAAERMWILGGTVGGLVLVLIGYFLLIGPQRSTTSSVKQQVAAAQAQEQSLATRIAALRNDYKNLPKYEAQLAAAQAALPAGSGVTDLLRELQTIGAATSTTVSSVSIGTPTAVAPASTSASSTTSTTTAPPTAATPSGIYSMTISASVAGSASGLNKFLQQLQEVQPRAVLITQLTEANTASTSGETDRASTLSLSMLAFMTSNSSTATSTP